MIGHKLSCLLRSEKLGSGESISMVTEPILTATMARNEGNDTGTTDWMTTLTQVGNDKDGSESDKIVLREEEWHQ
jgi:hypothetical protein